jgi:flagellar M-ring protein FliF
MNQIRKLFASLTLRQQVSIGVAILVVGIGLWQLSKWNHERDFSPLYANLPAEDAGEVIAKLKTDNIEYRVDDSAIRVPSDKVAEVRLRMASAGLPKTGRIGFELFDKSNFGLTEFAEQVNYRRAIEGELERSIMALTEIERARVHISLPKDSVFLESKQEAKASVVVSLRAGARLSAQNGAAITYLVASAVDRLSPDAVSLIDSRGNLLIRPRKASADAGSDQPEVDMEYRQKMERDLVLKISSTLEPLLGAEKFRAGASVDVDFSSAEQSEENYDPSRSVMVTAQKTEDVSGVTLQAGIPGTATNLPRPPARQPGSGGGATRSTENISYQTSRTVRRTRLPQGAVKRMSLAVLLDQNVRWEGKGAKIKKIIEPPSPEKIKTIRGLVAAATGFSETRGDQLTVETLPFESTLGAEPPSDAPLVAAPPPSPLPAWLQKYVKDMSAGMLIGIGLAALIILIAPIVLLSMRKRKSVAAQATAAAALNEGGEVGSSFEGQLASRAASQERLDAEALLAMKLPAAGTKKSEILSKHLKKAVKDDPAVSAQLLRTWIHENET